MKTKANEGECMIWTPDGIWYQYVDEFQNVGSSFVGRISRRSVDEFCRENRLALSTFEGERRTGAVGSQAELAA